jgi:hypothetical protein
LGFFLYGCLALRTTEELREEVHALTYITQGGFSYTEVMGMERSDRDWHIARLARQKADERREIDSMKSKRKR